MRGMRSWGLTSYRRITIGPNVTRRPAPGAAGNHALREPAHRRPVAVSGKVAGSTVSATGRFSARWTNLSTPSADAVSDALRAY